MEVKYAQEHEQCDFVHLQDLELLPHFSPLRLVSHSPILSEKMPSLADPFFRNNLMLFR